MRYAIDRAYDFIDTWGIPRSWLQTLQGAVVMGETCEGALTLIPCQGQTADTLMAQLKAMFDPPTERQPIERGEMARGEVIAGRARQAKGSDTTGNTDNVSHGKTDTSKARGIKHDRDTTRRQEQLAKLSMILRETPGVSISEIARQLNVSRATVRKLVAVLPFARA